MVIRSQALSCLAITARLICHVELTKTYCTSPIQLILTVPSYRVVVVVFSDCAHCMQWQILVQVTCCLPSLQYFLVMCQVVFTNICCWIRIPGWLSGLEAWTAVHRVTVMGSNPDLATIPSLLLPVCQMETPVSSMKVAVHHRSPRLP